jgi:hypothetical protein
VLEIGVGDNVPGMVAREGEEGEGLPDLVLYFVDELTDLTQVPTYVL